MLCAQTNLIFNVPVAVLIAFWGVSLRAGGVDLPVHNASSLGPALLASRALARSFNS